MDKSRYKFRALCNGRWIYYGTGLYGTVDYTKADKTTEGQYTGLKDSKGKEIYFGDILRFNDKWEWYRGQYAIKMMFATEEKREELQAQYDAEPFEERIVESIEDYEWLLSSEIQSYWDVIGNIYENPELLS